MKLKRAGAGPGTLQIYVFKVILDQLANARRAVDMRNNFQEIVRSLERCRNRRRVGRLVLIAHRPGGDAHRTIVEGTIWSISARSVGCASFLATARARR